MCVDVVKSIALKPTWSITGAIVRVFAVSIPGAAQRHWLPSRSEVSTSSMSAKGGALRAQGIPLQQPRHELGIYAAREKLWLAEHDRVEGQVGCDPAYFSRRDRVVHPPQCRGAVRGMRNDLGHQRVIVRRNPGARGNMRIYPYTRTGRPSRLGDDPRAWTEVAGGILGVHSALDRAASPSDIGLLQAKTVAAGDRDLLGDQVHPGDDLGHRMLDLDPRVHLEKVKRLLLVDQELHRAGAAIGKALREAYGGLVEAATQEFWQSRCR